MRESQIPRLCAGTFFTLVLQAILPRKTARDHAGGRGDIVTEPMVLAGLMRVINPDCTVTEIGRAATSKFKSCELSYGTDIPLGNTSEVFEFNRRVKEDYAAALSGMEAFAGSFLDMGTASRKDLWLCCALIDLVLQDASINDDDKFYIEGAGKPVRKREFAGLEEVYLPALLLGVWHYVLVTRKDNSVGKDTYDLWCQSMTKGAGRKFTSDVGRRFMNSVILNPSFTVKEEESAQDAPEPAAEFVNAESDSGSARAGNVVQNMAYSPRTVILNGTNSVYIEGNTGTMNLKFG